MAAPLALPKSQRLLASRFDRSFGARENRAQAIMDPSTEREVLFVSTVEIEPIRLENENRFIRGARS